MNFISRVYNNVFKPMLNNLTIVDHSMGMGLWASTDLVHLATVDVTVDAEIPHEPPAASQISPELFIAGDCQVTSLPSLIRADYIYW